MNIPTDGIIKAGKHIDISLIFKFEFDLNRFQSELIELISVFSGHTMPLVNADETVHPLALILQNQLTEPIAPVQLVRVFKMDYKHDFTDNDPDNSGDCDAYSDIQSLHSIFGDVVNIDDPEVPPQMIEDPHSPYWSNMSPEAAHIKDKAKSTKSENSDPNNFIYMSRFLHCYFDGLNAKPPKFPLMKIQYVSHDEELILCPLFGSGYNQLGLPRRQRMVVRIIFWDPSVRKYAMAFIREGGTDINPVTYEMNLYFQDAKKAKAYLEWKIIQTEKAWTARRQGIPDTEFVIAERIGVAEEDTADAMDASP